MRFLKSKAQILAFGETEEVNFQADASKLTETLRQVEQALQSYNVALESTVQASAKATKEGIAFTGSLKQVGDAGTRVTTVIEGVASAEGVLSQQLKVTSQSIEVTRGREEKLREERERAKRVSIELAEADIKRAQAAKLAAQATTGAISRRLQPSAAVSGGFGASVDEARQLGNALGRLQEIQQRFNVSQEKVISIFNRVRTGGISAYSGVNRQIANASLSILKTNAALGTSARALNDVARAGTLAGKANVQAAQKSEIGWRSFGRLIFVNVVSRAFGALIQVIRESITLAAEFSISIAEVRTIQGENVRTTEQWVGELRELSEAYGIPIVDAAEAAYQTLSNQIAKGAEVTLFLADAQKFAIASVSSLTDSTNLLSSAINAYGLDVRDADEISDSFFKTIELGRLRAGEIANSFGRVGVIASQLGITLNETNAAIATLTIQGIRSDEALTLLRNIMLKLIRPTDEMKKKFEEFGVTSGEALIQTFGFAGAVQKFSEIATREGTPAIGDLFGRVRAITGILGLARDNGEAFADTLQQIENSAGATDAAVVKITETIGFRFRKEVQAIQNFITVDLGEKLLTTLLEVGDVFGGLVNLVKGFAVALGILTAAFVVFKIATLALAATPIGLLVTGLALLIAGAVGLAVAFNDAGKEIDETIDGMIEDFNELRDAEIKASDEVNKELKRSLAERFKLRQQEIAEERALINRQLQFELDVLKTADKELKRTFREATRALKDSIRDAEQEANRALKEIERSVKRVREAIQQDLVDQFSKSLEGLLPVEQVDALDARITDLISDAGRLFEEIGNDAGVTFDDVLAQLDAAADRIREIDKIRRDAIQNIERLEDRRGKILRKNSDAEIKFLRRRSDLEAQFRKAQGDPEKQAKIIERVRRLEEDANRGIQRRRSDFTKIEESLKVQQDLIKAITENSNRQLEVSQQLRTLEEARQARLKDEAALAKQTATEEKERLRKFETAFMALQAFDPIKILEKGTAEEAKAQLDAAANAARAGLTLIEDGAERRRIIESIETKRLAALNAIRLQETKAALDSITKDLEKRRKTAVEGINAAILKEKELNKVIEDESTKALEAFRKVLKDAEKDRGPFDKVILQLEGPFKQALQGGTEEVRKFIKEVSDFQTSLGRSGFNIGVVSPAFEAAIDQLIDVGRSLSVAAKAQEDVTKIGTGLAEIRTNLGLAQPGALNFKNQFKEAREAAEGINAALEAEIKIQKRLNNIRAQREGFAHGGLVPGRGTGDTIPAMLSPGEFVVNAASTRKFFTQLQAINSGRIQTFQQGGPVSNFGDINVSIQGEPANVDGRTIALAIKRELFRGSVKLR